MFYNTYLNTKVTRKISNVEEYKACLNWQAILCNKQVTYENCKIYVRVDPSTFHIDSDFTYPPTPSTEASRSACKLPTTCGYSILPITSNRASKCSSTA